MLNTDNNNDIQQLIKSVSKIKARNDCNSESLIKLGCGLSPITYRCLMVGMDILQRSSSIWDVSTQVQNRRQFIYSAIEYEGGISYKWELLLLVLPQFREQNISRICINGRAPDDLFPLEANTNGITSDILLQELLSIMNDESYNINKQCIISCIVYWMQNYWTEDFYGNDELQRQLSKDWIDYNEIRLEYERLALPAPLPSDTANNDGTCDPGQELNYNKVLPKIVAEQLTLISYDKFNKIRGSW